MIVRISVYIIYLVIVPLILAMTSCSGSTTSPGNERAAVQPLSLPPSEIALDASYNGKEIRLGAGSLLKIALDSNRTTGYSWELSEIGDKSVLEKVNNTYETPPFKMKEGEAPRVGVGGVEFWSFKTLKAGKCRLTMEYSQPWTGGSKGAKKFEITVVVE